MRGLYLKTLWQMQNILSGKSLHAIVSEPTDGFYDGKTFPCYISRNVLFGEGKGIKKFCDKTCIGMEDIRITFDPVWNFCGIIVNNVLLGCREMEALAANEGYSNWSIFIGYYEDLLRKRKLNTSFRVFRGVIIHWTEDVRYGKTTNNISFQDL